MLIESSLYSPYLFDIRNHMKALPPQAAQRPFSRKHKLLRGVFAFCWVPLDWIAPRWPFWPRRLLLQVFGAKFGAGSVVYPKVKVWAPWNLRCGCYVALGDGADIYNLAPITIGDRATISQRAVLCAGTHDFRRRAMPLVAKPIQVGSDVWICAEAFVGPGVSIGNGAVLGARGVLFRDLGESKIAAGNPARVIGDRDFND